MPFIFHRKPAHQASCQKKWLLYGALALAGVLLLRVFVEHLEPEVDDGEAEGEFDPDLPDARPGDVLLFNRAKGFNRLITQYTRSPYYHVAICCAPYHVVEARPRGVVIRDLRGTDGDKRFEVIPAENVGGREAAQKALEWAITQVGDGYDPLSSVAVVLHRTFNVSSGEVSLHERWACGEFVATAFETAGVKLFEKPVTAVVPADFEPLLHD